MRRRAAAAIASAADRLHVGDCNVAQSDGPSPIVWSDGLWRKSIGARRYMRCAMKSVDFPGPCAAQNNCGVNATHWQIRLLRP